MGEWLTLPLSETMLSGRISRGVQIRSDCLHHGHLLYADQEVHYDRWEAVYHMLDIATYPIAPYPSEVPIPYSLLID